MTHDATPEDEVPHDPRRTSAVEVEGFESSGRGRDIFFAAVENTRMPMVVADPRRHDVPIVFANDAFLEMTGYARDDVVGQNCRFLQGPDTDRETVDRIRDAVRSEREITVELLNYRKDGSSFWNALFLTPVRDPAGQLLYFFSSQLDISRRKDAETALQHAQKMEALGQLTGGIAHDFNNLLQIILGNVDVATVLTRGVDNRQLERTLGNIREAARKSGTLTQQLLAFARKQQLQGRVINLSEQAAQLADLAQRTLGEAISLERHLEPHLWNARVDPTQVEVALLNLLVNARDALPSGGTVSLRTANVDVGEHDVAQHGVPRAGRYCVVSVSDDGCGIPPQILPRVMDPFFTTKPIGEGTGLGLSMVYGFAKQSGGVATIDSEAGVGTTVRLYFPATADSLPKADRRRSPRENKGTERVLIVDDRPEIAEMAAMILTQAGYDCEESMSAESALATLSADASFRLLVTDLIMPGGMNGVLLAREAQRRDPGLRVLLMTGFADGTPERWGGEHFDMIFKPFSADDLQRKVRLAIDGATGIN